MNLHPFLPIFHARSNFKFDRARNTAQIGSKSIEMISNSISQSYKCNLSEFQPILSSISCPVEFEIRPVKFDWPRNTAQIGSKSIEMIPNSISQSYKCNLSEFTPIFTNISCPVKFQIRPGMKYCSIWVEIHGFTPNLSSISGLVKLGIIPMNLLPF